MKIKTKVKAGSSKYPGVDGESKDTNHEKWIDVLSIG